MNEEETQSAIQETVARLVQTVWPTDIEVRIVRDERGYKTELYHDDPRVMAAITGYEGRNIKAVRQLMKIWGRNNGIQVFCYTMPRHG